MAPEIDDLDAYAGVCGGTNGQAATAPRRHRQEFIKGPLPVAWMARAAGLRGQALAVALAIWFRRGIERAGTFPLYPSALDRFGVNRWSAYRGLTALEKAGLVIVHRRRGRSPAVTILDVPEPPGDSRDHPTGKAGRRSPGGRLSSSRQ
jgi:hypothetical protein